MAPASETEEAQEKRRQMAALYSHKYYCKNRAKRNDETRARMARLRAQDTQLPPDVLNARRAARCEATRKYREKNQSRLAEEAREARSRAKADKAREAQHQARVARVTARLQANRFYHNLIMQ
ncbi:hypothetical protein B0H14DRAFT_2588138 [Mycena olivaceomarginata]|nr:hypothetical protein B0H14DRAFT_2588138 [Mycena olivaceomarginata]